MSIANVYNRQVTGGHSVLAEIILWEASEPILVVGDLNIHMSLRDP